jgi:hypothetical protein
VIPLLLDMEVRRIKGERPFHKLVYEPDNGRVSRDVLETLDII